MGLENSDHGNDSHQESKQQSEGPIGGAWSPREFDWGKLWWVAVLAVLAAALIQEIRWASGHSEPWKLVGASDPCNQDTRVGLAWLSPVAMDAQAVLAEINAYRAEHGRRPLQPSALLDGGANKEARLRARQANLSEQARNQDPFGQQRLVVTGMGQQYRARRTLVAVHWSAGAIRSERALIESWASCPTTRDALLDRHLDHMGFSTAEGYLKRGPLKVRTIASVMWLSEHAPE